MFLLIWIPCQSLMMDFSINFSYLKNALIVKSYLVSTPYLSIILVPYSNITSSFIMINLFLIVILDFQISPIIGDPGWGSCGLFEDINLKYESYFSKKYLDFFWKELRSNLIFEILMIFQTLPYQIHEIILTEENVKLFHPKNMTTMIFMNKIWVMIMFLRLVQRKIRAFTTEFEFMLA